MKECKMNWLQKISSTPKTQKCKYCKEQATKEVIWADGRAYVPVCDKHEEKAIKVIIVDNHDEVLKIREKK